jgi:hypothetical protein
VTKGAHSFAARYRSPSGDKALSLSISIPTPGPGTSRVQQRQLSFRGYATAEYQVDDGVDPRSSRWLIWHEPGTWRDETETNWHDGPPYLLSASGFTDAEFWALASSLQPVERGVSR